jgi:hypothetical protein
MQCTDKKWMNEGVCMWVTSTQEVKGSKGAGWLAGWRTKRVTSTFIDKINAPNFDPALLFFYYLIAVTFVTVYYAFDLKSETLRRRRNAAKKINVGKTFWNRWFWLFLPYGSWFKSVPFFKTLSLFFIQFGSIHYSSFAFNYAYLFWFLFC